MFNPFRSRASLLAQGIDFVRRFARLDRRMHNTLMLADGREAAIAGRNFAGEPFGLEDTMNLVDFHVRDPVEPFVVGTATRWGSRPRR